MLGHGSKLGKHNDRITALEDAMRLMERLSSSGSGAANSASLPLLDTLKDQEKRIKEWCAEMFPEKESFNAQSERLYKLDHSRVKKLEEEMAKLKGGADLAKQMENMNKRIGKQESAVGE